MTLPLTKELYITSMLTWLFTKKKKLLTWLLVFFPNKTNKQQHTKPTLTKQSSLTYLPTLNKDSSVTLTLFTARHPNPLTSFFNNTSLTHPRQVSPRSTPFSLRSFRTPTNFYHCFRVLGRSKITDQPVWFLILLQGFKLFLILLFSEIRECFLSTETDQSCFSECSESLSRTPTP